MASKSDLQKKHFGTVDFGEILAEDTKRVEENRHNVPTDLKVWVETDFPYYVPENELPCPLPTMAEIEAVRETENDLTRDSSLRQQIVYKVSGVYAVKFSPSRLMLQEAENLLFLAENTQIRVPKVYAAFSHQGADPLGQLRNPNRWPDRSSLSRFYYIIMEYIPGKGCDFELWEGLSPQAQQNVMRKIAAQMRLLRNVPTPSPEYYGRIHRRGWHPHFDQLENAGPPGQLRGPYDSHEDFINAIYTTSEYICCSQYGEEFTPTTKLYLQTFHEIMSRAVGKEPVLSHLDFRLDQVLFLEKPEDKEDPDIVILDWATMGWVPAYMDTVRSFDTSWNPEYSGIYDWEMSRDVEPAHLDTALYFKQFLEETFNSPW